MEAITEYEEPEPHWPALITVAVVGGLYLALPSSLAVGPRWLFPALAGGLALPSFIAFRAGRHGVNAVLGHLLAAVLTAFMVWSLVLLIRALPAHTEAPVAMLRSAAALWTTNILVFGLWYWRLDAGGPHQRALKPGHDSGAFLFPQMTLNPENLRKENPEPWSPMFIDYLFLAFNTSTAFSPTDVPVLSRWAKVLMMIQSTISLAVIAVLAARSINIL